MLKKIRQGNKLHMCPQRCRQVLLIGKLKKHYKGGLDVFGSVLTKINFK